MLDRTLACAGASIARPHDPKSAGYGSLPSRSDSAPPGEVRPNDLEPDSNHASTRNHAPPSANFEHGAPPK